MKNNLENGLWGMFWMGGMTVANFLIQLVITSFLARLLSPSDYGEVAALTVLIGLADIFWMMGVGPGIVQKNEITDEDISTGQNLNILFGIIVFAIINIFADGFDLTSFQYDPRFKFIFNEILKRSRSVYRHDLHILPLNGLIRKAMHIYNCLEILRPYKCFYSIRPLKQTRTSLKRGAMQRSLQKVPHRCE